MGGGNTIRDVLFLYEHLFYILNYYYIELFSTQFYQAIVGRYVPLCPVSCSDYNLLSTRSLQTFSGCTGIYRWWKPHSRSVVWARSLSLRGGAMKMILVRRDGTDLKYNPNSNEHMKCNSVIRKSAIEWRSKMSH